MEDLVEEVNVEEAKELASRTIQISELKNEKNIMLYPFCSTSKGKRRESIKYSSPDGTVYIEVTANHEYGMAKIWDFDILRFVFSKIDAIASRTGHHPSTVSFSAYECLKFLNKNPNAGKNVSWLKGALDRLASTTYKGNIYRNDMKLVSGFTLIKYDYVDSDASIDKIQITLDERLVDSLRTSTALMNISSKLLEEPSGLKKRLIELVSLKTREHDTWVVTVPELKQLCANTWSDARFKCEIKKITDLDWYIQEKLVSGNKSLVFTKK